MKTAHPILDIEWGVIPIVSYRGVYIAKLPNGHYLIWGHEVSEPEEIDKIIDNSLLSLTKSLKK